MAKSEKLQLELQNDATKKSVIIPDLANDQVARQDSDTVQIKPIECLNDFVAVLKSQVKSTIELGDAKFKNEGMVVGIGPGLPDGSGSRVASQLSLGDMVIFRDNAVALQLDSENGHYAGQSIVILSEKSLICKAPKKPFVVLKD
jgi:co-chaperonin GroES (HSP10)